MESQTSRHTSCIETASTFIFMHCSKIKCTLRPSDTDWILIWPNFNFKNYFFLSLLFLGDVVVDKSSDWQDISIPVAEFSNSDVLPTEASLCNAPDALYGIQLDICLPFIKTDTFWSISSNQTKLFCSAFSKKSNLHKPQCQPVVPEGLSNYRNIYSYLCGSELC